MSHDHHALDAHLPRIARALRRLPLTEALPTPVEPVDLPDAAGLAPPPGGLWVKRDDQTGTRYGGNKVRKLEYILADAMDKGHDTLWTTGAIGSHHALATALFAQQRGLEVHVLHFPQPITPHVVTNLRALVATGAHLRLATTRARVPVEGVRDHLERWIAGRVREYIVPAGGSSPLGVLGYVNAAFELADQVRAGAMPCPARIYVALGSAGTFAGLWLGVRLAKLPVEVVGVRVVDLLFCNAVVAAHLAAQTLAMLHDLDPTIEVFPIHASDLAVRHTAFGDGYGESTRGGLRAMELFESAGVHLDQTYTGKTAAAMLDDLARPNLRPDGPVLFWNTLSSADLAPLIDSVPFDALPEPYLAFIREHGGDTPDGHAPGDA